jgi:hypothetical protein
MSGVNQKQMAQNAADLRCLSIAQSELALDSWLCSDFKSLAVEMTHYSL